MKIAVIYFTNNGENLAKKCKALCPENEWEMFDGRTGGNKDTQVGNSSGQKGSEATDGLQKKALRTEWLARQFECQTPILFISSTGIAVRLIAPFLESKTTDSPVLVADDQGKFVIPLVSGHLGGANELAEKLSKVLEAIPVITTATDNAGVFAVDIFAKKNHLTVKNPECIKLVSGKLLRGEKVTFSYAESITKEQLKFHRLPAGVEVFEPVTAQISELLTAQISELSTAQISELSTAQICESAVESRDMRTQKDMPTPDFYIGDMSEAWVINSANVLNLIPRQYVLGIGCRKGKSFEELRDFVTELLQENDIPADSIRALVSIDVKKEEPGILMLGKFLQVPFEVFTAEELKAAPGEFATSSFVESQVGVDNVCERSVATYICKKGSEKVNLGGDSATVDKEFAGKTAAISDDNFVGKAAEDVEWIIHKTARDGMTLAVGKMPWEVIKWD